MARPGLPTRDKPVNAGEVEMRKRSEERFGGDKTDGRRDASQRIRPNLWKLEITGYN
jgi:hypothetical protein